MAGTAASQVRSACIAETTPGTIPTSPAFTTLHAPARMNAAAAPIFGRSLIGGGARMGHGVSGIEVTGTLETPLIYGVYDTLFETLLQGAWSSNVLKDGKAIKTVTVENTMPAGVGGTATMLRYRGVEALSGVLNLSSRAEARLTLNLGGMGSDAGATTALGSATYTDPTEADPLSSGVDVGTITFAGYTLDCMQSLEVNFAFEGRDPQPKISSNDLCGFTRGDCMPVLTAMIYLETNFLAIYNAARARHASFPVTVPLGSVTGEKYTMVFPACHFGAVGPDLSSPSLMQRVEILPAYDTSTDCVVQITRAVA